MALNGNLDAFPLPEVLRLLARSQQTGVLVIMTNNGETRAYLEDGKLMFACDGDAATLRHGLVAAGLVPAAEWPEIMAGVVVAEDVLAPHASAADLQSQVFSISIDAFVEALKSDDASFEFEDDVTTGLQLSTSIDIDKAIVATEERFVHWNSLAEQIPSAATKLALTSGLPDEAGEIILSEREWSTIAEVAEHRTRTAIVRHTGWSDYEVAVAIGALFDLGLVEVVTSANGRPVEVFSETPKSDPLPNTADGLTDADAVMAGLVTDGNGLGEWGNELDSIAPSTEIPENSLAPMVGSDGPSTEFTSTDDFSFELQGLGERNTLERTRPIRDEDIAAAAQNVELPLSALLAEHAVPDESSLVRSYEPVADDDADVDEDPELEAELLAEAVAQLERERGFVAEAELNAEPVGTDVSSPEPLHGEHELVADSEFADMDQEEDVVPVEAEAESDHELLGESEYPADPDAEVEIQSDHELISDPELVDEDDADAEAEVDPDHEPVGESEFVAEDDAEVDPDYELVADSEFGDMDQEEDVVPVEAEAESDHELLGESEYAADADAEAETQADHEPIYESELLDEDDADAGVEAEVDPDHELLGESEYAADADAEPEIQSDHEPVYESELLDVDEDVADADADAELESDDAIEDSETELAAELDARRPAGLDEDNSAMNWLASEDQEEPAEDSLSDDASLDDQLESVIGGLGEISDELSLEMVEGESELLEVDPELAPSDLDLAEVVNGLSEVGSAGVEEITQDASSHDDSSDREETATDPEAPKEPKPRPARKRRSRGLLSRELSSLND